jgi:hypothetical protein
MGWREAGFDSPDIWHSPIPVKQLPESLLADNSLHQKLQMSKRCLDNSFTLENFPAQG